MNGQQADWLDVRYTASGEQKARHILTLEERVRAIREFDRHPVYQKVADIMNCSAKQIRNIIQNRESILLYYASKTGECQSAYPKRHDRTEKIKLLNRVMFEWIQRTQAREDIGRISTKLLRTIALDVKNQISVPSFYPNTVWLESFMHQYKMTEEDLQGQRLYSRCLESKEHLSLKISDIVADVEALQPKQDKPNKDFHYRLAEKKDTPFEYKPDDMSMMFDNSNSATGDDYHEVRVVIEEDDDNDGGDAADDGDDDDDDDYMFGPPQAKAKKVESKKDCNGEGEKCIDTYEDALRHLKPLEDFVLLEDNFRAIGIISQLEAIFRNPQKFHTN